MNQLIEHVEGEETTGSKRVLIPVALAAFITGLDNTIVTVAAPVIGDELKLSFTQLEWVATAYILSFSSLMLVGGRLTDRFGRRRILQVGLAIFLISSIFAAIAPTGDLLIAARALQGIGGALVLPATFAVIATDLTGQNRHLGSGVLMAAIASSLALGPLVGGLFSQHVDWRWIFWINLPLVLGTMWMITRTMASSEVAIVGPDGEPPVEGSRRARRLEDPRARRAAAWKGLDTPGLILVTLALIGITYVLVQGQAHGFTSPSILSMAGLGVVCLIAFVIVEGRGTAPLIDVSLFRNRVVAGGTIVQTLWGLGINGVFFFTSIFLQRVLGFSPTTAGLCFMPLAIALVAAVPVAAWLAVRIGAHRTVALGMFLMAGGLFVAGFHGRGSTFLDLLPSLLVLGFGSALTTPLTSAIFEAVPEKQAGVASALVSTFREMSGVLGIAITGAVLVARESSALRGGAAPTDAFTVGYHTALFAAAALVAAGGLTAYVTLNVRPASRGSEAEPYEYDDEAFDEPWYEDPELLERSATGLSSAPGTTMPVYLEEEDAFEGDSSGRESFEHESFEHESFGHESSGEDDDLVIDLRELDLEWPDVEASAPGGFIDLRDPVFAGAARSSVVSSSVGSSSADSAAEYSSAEYSSAEYSSGGDDGTRRGRRAAAPPLPARQEDWVAAPAGTPAPASRRGRHALPPREDDYERWVESEAGTAHR